MKTTLESFTKSAEGKDAFLHLYDALKNRQRTSQVVTAENDFILAAATYTGEKSPDNKISGNEKKAHEMLHFIVTQDDKGLDKIKSDLNL